MMVRDDDVEARVELKDDGHLCCCCVRWRDVVPIKLVYPLPDYGGEGEGTEAGTERRGTQSQHLPTRHNNRG